jgi:glycerophosphoryl diester phosphodiesterase
MPRALAALMTTLVATAATAAEPAKVEIVAHRGASFDAPENTVAAIKLAWVQKADASEFDVLLTKDGKLVVIHDATTKRTAGADLKVAETTLEELRKLDAGRWKAEKFAGEKLPTLEEMLATVPAGKRVFIEIKCGPEAVPEMDRVLKASKLKPEQTCVISFNADVVAASKKARPDLQALWIVNLAPKNQKPRTAEELIEKAKAIKADGLDLSATPAVLDKAFGDKVRAAGLKLYVWTVNDAELTRKMIAAGAESITTDRPGWLREQLAK